ncbi:MAG TPA: hypothetical protein VKF41_10685 [Bryobacteraceae bacterium]|nr:hypothetical protein [Bryobacteraceae bacterium]
MLLRTSRAVVLPVSMLVLAAGLAAQNPPQDRERGRFRPDDGAPGRARFLGAQAGAPGRLVRNAPYSADVVTEITQTLADGNRIHQVGTSKVYRDGEGRTRTEQSLSGLSAIAPNSNLPKVIFLQDPVAGSSYALDATRKTATKSAWQRAGRGFGAKSVPGGGGTVKEESLGRQTVEGVPADGTRTTTVIPAGQVGNEQPVSIVTERWYSPDLQVYLLSRHTDPRSGETVTRLTNLTRGEPAHSLFEVPADFKVVEENWPGWQAPRAK